MKKTIFLSFFFFIGVLTFAQEFDIQWLSNMSNYLSKQIRDIPDEYIQSPNSREIYERNLPNNIKECFIVKNNIIVGVMWVKKFSSRSTLYSEYDNCKALLINRFGRVILNSNGADLFNWNSRIITLVVDGNDIGIALVLPEAVGMSQYLWEKILETISE